MESDGPAFIHVHDRDWDGNKKEVKKVGDAKETKKNYKKKMNKNDIVDVCV